MNFRYLLFFIILAAPVFCADTSCGTAYHDTLNVRVLDGNYRPVPGASVFIHYQYSGTSGPGGSTYYTAGPVITNSSGIARIEVNNVEAVESSLDCAIDINATIGGTTNTTGIIAKSHPDPVDVRLDAYPASISLREASGNPIQGASVTIRNVSEATDQNGYVLFYLPAGNYDYLASFLDGKQPGSFTVSDDTQFAITLRSYSIGVEAMDDQGRPLNATLIFADRTVQLGPDGRFSNPKTFGTAIQFNAVYAGVTKAMVIYPEIRNDTRVVFDFTAPTIQGITQSEASGKMRLTVRVSDENLYASGIDPASFSVTYLQEPSPGTTQWNKATTFVQKKDVFVADFPEFGPNTLVQFRVEVSDMDGNKAVQEGHFLIPAPPPPPANTTNGTGTQQPPPQPGEGLPVVYIAGGVVLILVIYFMFSRLKGGGG